MDTLRKNVLVTGGSRGIGKAIALKFAENNYNVAISYRQAKDKARETVSLIEDRGVASVAIRTDFLQENAVDNLFSQFDAHFDQLHILVNNAGWTKYIPHENLDDLTGEVFDKIIAINLKSMYMCSREAVKRMTSDNCSIISISSIAAYNGIGSNIAYCAAKAGIVVMTKSLARILAPNIRVNAVAPGLTETDMTESGPGSYRSEQIDMTPLGRIATPEDIADTVFSLEHDLKFVNGKTIIVDGGRLS